MSLHRMLNFSEEDLPSLCEAVIGALELFAEKGLPQTPFREFEKPLIVGSGNAIVTAKALYANTDAIFADETSYKETLHRECDGVIIFSASGGKHAPIIAQAAKDAGKAIQLITCNINAPAIDIVGEENTIITPKNREPYTYNTSTYLGWLLAKTKEDPRAILSFIKEYVDPYVPKDFEKYRGYLLVTPNEFEATNQLFIVKFIELFGRKIARDVKSYEETKHAITVVSSSQEMCIRFAKRAEEIPIDFVGPIWTVNLPDSCDMGAMMAIAYYVIGKIQEQLPQYFKDNIKQYINRNNNSGFGSVMSVIVE